MRLSTRQAFFIILVIGLFLMTMRPIADPDYWWHLKTGQVILETHAIPHTDPFSYTKAGAPWITHEWLIEILMYGIFKYFGPAYPHCTFFIDNHHRFSPCLFSFGKG